MENLPITIKEPKSDISLCIPSKTQSSYLFQINLSGISARVFPLFDNFFESLLFCYAYSFTVNAQLIKRQLSSTTTLSIILVKFIFKPCIIAMLNNIFKPTVSRPSTYSPYYANKQVSENAIKANTQHKYRRYRLLIIILQKALKRVLQQSWQQLWRPERRALEALSKMSILCNKNSNYSLYLAFDCIKKASVQSKVNQKLIKSMINLLQRIEKYKLKQSFSRIFLFSSRQNANILNTILQRRDHQFTRKLQSLVRQRKKEVLLSIGRYATFVKSYSKVRVIAVIHNRFQKQLKHLVFAKLARFIIAKNSKSSMDREVKELKTQLQDMTAQLQNKNDSIQRLEEELNQIRVQQSAVSIHHNLSYGQPPLPKNKTGSFKSYSLKKLATSGSRNKLSHNESGDNLSINDLSIGSLLGNLNRSRAGSNSKYDPSCDCNCGFKTKYVKYKSLNQSLKNQLEIVKEELQVAKDLNEHFTNEIKQYLTGEANQGEYDKLKKEHKLLLDERDQLREKVFKYQKHISNLKAQFKVKMEEIYRKVRKDM